MAMEYVKNNIVTDSQNDTKQLNKEEKTNRNNVEKSADSWFCYYRSEANTQYDK